MQTNCYNLKRLVITLIYNKAFSEVLRPVFPILSSQFSFFFHRTLPDNILQVYITRMTLDVGFQFYCLIFNVFLHNMTFCSFLTSYF